MPLPIAVLISGGGSNLQAVIDSIECGSLDAEIKVVVSNDPNAFGVERARKHGLYCKVISHTDFSNRDEFDQALVEEIKLAGAEFVVLAGFMRILSPGFIRAFPNRIINIHPAILPSFAGLNAQAQQADFGVRLAGCTVHFVDEKMDNGPIIIQAVLPAHVEDDGDSLGRRILEYEHRVYPQAIQWMAQNRLTIEGRKVFLKDCLPAARIGRDVLVNPPLEQGF